MSRSDLLNPTTAPLPPVHPLGFTPLHGPPRHEHLVLILGVGPGMGLAIAETFAKQGYATAILSRSIDRLSSWARELETMARQRLISDAAQGSNAPSIASGSTSTSAQGSGQRIMLPKNAESISDEQDEVWGPLSRAVACDVLDTESVKAAVAEAISLFPRRRLGTAIYNASVRKKAPFLDQTEGQMADSLQASVLSAFAFMQACVKAMVAPSTSGGPVGSSGMPIGGNILVTGATSATRGRQGFAAFSAGKTGLRRLCEVVAREFGPQNIHCAHVIIDGLIDSETARSYLLGPAAASDADAPPSSSEGVRRFPDASVVLPPEAAKAFLFLAQQQSSAWTFEMDLRPAKEHF